MPRVASILKVDPQLVEELNTRIDSNQYTHEELVAWLDSKGVRPRVSRSALGRYTQQRRGRQRAAELIGASAASAAPGSEEQALDLMLELATLRLREAKVVERLKELGVI